MDDTVNWAQQTIEELCSAGTVMDRHESKELQIERFIKLVRRVDTYPDCPDCRALKLRITLLSAELSHAMAMTKAERRDYLGGLEVVSKHLHKKHKLVSEGQNLAIWMSLGTAAGMALGATLNNTAFGLALGLSVGLAMGAALDARAKRNGRVI